MTFLEQTCGMLFYMFLLLFLKSLAGNYNNKNKNLLEEVGQLPVRALNITQLCVTQSCDYVVRK